MSNPKSRRSTGRWRWAGMRHTKIKIRKTNLECQLESMRYKIQYTSGKQAGMCPGINSLAFAHGALIAYYMSWNQRLIGLEGGRSFDAACRGRRGAAAR